MLGPHRPDGWVASWKVGQVWLLAHVLSRRPNPCKLLKTQDNRGGFPRVIHGVSKLSESRHQGDFVRLADLFRIGHISACVRDQDELLPIRQEPGLHAGRRVAMRDHGGIDPEVAGAGCRCNVSTTANTTRQLFAHGNQSLFSGMRHGAVAKLRNGKLQRSGLGTGRAMVGRDCGISGWMPSGAKTDSQFRRNVVCPSFIYFARRARRPFLHKQEVQPCRSTERVPGSPRA